MSYNKARAEKEWIRWKHKEEQQLRELGVDEEIIQRLHTYDWDVFKSDRRFYEKLADINEYVNVLFSKKVYPDTFTVEDILDCIKDRHLLRILKQSDRTTLEAVVLKIQGYVSKEIAGMPGLSQKTVNKRLERLWKR